MKSKRIIKRLLNITGIVAIIMGCLFFSYKAFLDPYRGTIKKAQISKDLHTILSKEEAFQDLNYIKEKLEERHPACVDGLPKEVKVQFEQEIAKITGEVTVLHLWQASARILAKLKDAHTGISFYANDPRRLPLTFTMTDGELYLTDKEYTATHVLSINDIPVQKLHQTFLEQFSYELESYATYLFTRNLRRREYLEFVGVDTSSAIQFNFQEGSSLTKKNFAFDIPVQEVASTEVPFVSYHIDKNKKLGVITLRSCSINDYYRNTVKEFFQTVKDNNLQNVAIDLRNNGGGNSRVINEFMKYIDVDAYSISGGIDVRYGPFLYKFKKQEIKNKKNENLLFSGNVYALTSTDTFSSAQMFALTLLDNDIGTIIGEIPGNMPACYGDILAFQTPNAKLVFTVSYKYFRRIDGSKAELPLIPHYEVKAKEAMDKLYAVIEAE
ncbi:hypothetical protein I5677_03650 [Mobilitalea sibirica]|uniref:Tail specific protease domain-containing protein n=1 Tax=Mobilitalea sibirica TaxID=1462919 RepID=A0A8J7H1G6_9FIRM|nr:S41 family peptidase [Mobilitalea sibirica]MBH1939990.1 hypothetical protein [Mobilitalea sibirica]